MFVSISCLYPSIRGLSAWYRRVEGNHSSHSNDIELAAARGFTIPKDHYTKRLPEGSFESNKFTKGALNLLSRM